MREKCEECVLFGAWFSLQLDAAFLQHVPFRVARGLGGRTEAAPQAFPGVQPSLSLPHRIAPRKKCPPVERRPAYRTAELSPVLLNDRLKVAVPVLQPGYARLLLFLRIGNGVLELRLAHALSRGEFHLEGLR